MNNTTNKLNKKGTSSCDEKNNINSNSTTQQSLGLASIGYADYVILSATLSYAIAEELNDLDLDMLIVFAGMITSDLALLRTRRGIINGINQANQQNTGEEATIGGEETIFAGEDIAAQLSAVRGSKKKRRKIKKVKRKKKRINISEDKNENK
ncbi:hypothetical protein HF520_05025 [Romboutsia sp. CE17]|uniref:hypothetical protein n=1 Tax=Romboutsia sp. CE17 TaxID=2724150 RepID=UPI001442D0A0|nr:hypothetical protein [Romboutsia sp. CE17]QJA08348.1 hypothetical protein HF520_05025 [Romboutsia sp. CE17]